jgi:uncharacterized damage-inducible protein DinB
MNPQHSNNTFLVPLQQQMEQQLQWVTKVVQNLPENTLHKPSATGGWSIAACLWHLNSYYAYYLPILEQKLQQTQVSKPFTYGWLGAYFTRIMEPGKQLKKYAAFKTHVPPPQLNGYATVYEFIQYHERFMQLLQQAQYANLNARIPISISKLIRLKAGDVFGFIIAHNKRHIQQAQRNVA